MKKITSLLLISLLLILTCVAVTTADDGNQQNVHDLTGSYYVMVKPVVNSCMDDFGLPVKKSYYDVLNEQKITLKLFFVPPINDQYQYRSVIYDEYNVGVYEPINTCTHKVGRGKIGPRVKSVVFSFAAQMGSITDGNKNVINLYPGAITAMLSGIIKFEFNEYGEPIKFAKNSRGTLIVIPENNPDAQISCTEVRLIWKAPELILKNKLK